MKQFNKKSLWLFLMPWCVATSAVAESVTVDVTATVSSVYDPYGVIGEITPGSTISGSYTYETTTPDQDPYLQVGFYPHEPGTGTLNLTMGSYQVVSDPAAPFDMFIDDESMPGFEAYHVNSPAILPSNGVNFYGTGIMLEADTGAALQDALLTATPPDLAAFNNRRSIEISGESEMGGQYFNVTADITSLQLASPPTRFTYRVSAIVDNVQDWDNTLAGRVEHNQLISAEFTYDTTTPNSSPVPESGIYQHEPGMGALGVTMGGIVLTSDPLVPGPDVLIENSDWSDSIHVLGNLLSSDPSLYGGAASLEFFGPDYVLSSIALPTDALDLTDWDMANLMVNGSNWQVEARIVSVERVALPAVESFPESGKVHPMQNVDVALRVNNDAEVVGITGTRNGQDFSFALWDCTILPKTDATQSVICPTMTWDLVDGFNVVQFQLQMSDGSVLTKEVTWQLTGELLL